MVWGHWGHEFWQRTIRKKFQDEAGRRPKSQLHKPDVCLYLGPFI